MVVFSENRRSTTIFTRRGSNLAKDVHRTGLELDSWVEKELQALYGQEESGTQAARWAGLRDTIQVTIAKLSFDFRVIWRQSRAERSEYLMWWRTSGLQSNSFKLNKSL